MTSPTTPIRPATDADLPAIMAIERASFPTDAWSDQMMRETLALHDAIGRVVEIDGEIVGYAAMVAAPGGDAEVLTIALTQAHRSRGHGRALLRTLIAAATDRRVERIFLEVRADNPAAEALYISEGFAPIGRRARYYQPDDVDAIVMRLDVAAPASVGPIGSPS